MISYNNLTSSLNQNFNPMQLFNNLTKEFQALYFLEMKNKFGLSEEQVINNLKFQNSLPLIQLGLQQQQMQQQMQQQQMQQQQMHQQQMQQQQMQQQQMQQQQMQQKQIRVDKHLNLSAKVYVPEKPLTDQEKYQIVKSIWEKYDKEEAIIEATPVLDNVPVNLPIPLSEKKNVPYYKKRYERKLNWENLRK